MSRFAATVVRDIRLLYRNKFFHAAGAIVVGMTTVLYFLPDDISRWLAPLVFISNFAMNGFYFLAAAMLLEHAESSLEVHLVTPLHSAEYLFAKILVVCGITLLESFAIALLSFARDYDYLLLCVACIVSTAVFAVAGFLVVLRYQSINRFLPPSILIVVLITLPVGRYFGWSAAWLAALPLYGGYELTAALAGSIDLVQMLQYVLLSCVWLGIGTWFGLRQFKRSVVGR